MSAIDELQAAVSRFGTTVGFGAVTASNTIDAETIAVVSSTLQWIHANVPAQADTAIGLLNQLSSADVIAQSASGIAIYLNQVANDLSLGGSNLNIPLLGSSSKIPNWIIYLAVAIAVIGGAALYMRYKKKRSQRALKGLPLGALEHHIADDTDEDEED